MEMEMEMEMQMEMEMEMEDANDRVDDVLPKPKHFRFCL